MGLKDSGVAYPRRADAVRFVRFDGTPESVQKIANITNMTVEMKIQPNNRFCDGDIIRFGDLRLSNGTRAIPPEIVQLGGYVVVDRDGKVKAMTAEAYEQNYSEDGN